MKIKLLKQLRTEAINNLDFNGCWEGVWNTKIKGVYYESNIVSSYCYVVKNDPGYFVQNAIAHRVHIMKYGEKQEERIYKKKDDRIYVSTEYRKREYRRKITQEKWI